MKNPLLLLLLLLICAVVSLTTPVSADYWFYKDVSAYDFTNKLIDYCNENTVRNMTGYYDFERSNHNFKAYNVIRTNDSLDFEFQCVDSYFIFIPVPIDHDYVFYGVMHVDNPQDGLKKPYILSIMDEDRKFTAVGKNWWLEARNIDSTRFYS